MTKSDKPVYDHTDCLVPMLVRVPRHEPTQPEGQRRTIPYSMEREPYHSKFP